MFILPDISGPSEGNHVNGGTKRELIEKPKGSRRGNQSSLTFFFFV